MNRVTGRLAVLVSLALFSAHSAQASDIACKATRQPHAGDPRPHAANLICDYALLSIGYDRIYAEQQRLLRVGAIRKADIVAWRRKRDACGTVRCLDGVFAQWHAYAARKTSMRASVPARERAAVPAPETPPHLEARGRPKPRRSEAEWAAPPRQSPQAPARLIATPGSAEPATRTAATGTSLQSLPAKAPAAPSTSKQAHGSVGSLGVLACAGVLGAGLAYRRTRKRARSVLREYGQNPAAPAARRILYGLIVLNVLLLVIALGTN